MKKARKKPLIIRAFRLGEKSQEIDKLIEEGAETLKAFRDKIDTTKMKEPSFMMIIVGVGSYAYRRDDGIYIVPIGCLKN